MEKLTLTRSLDIYTDIDNFQDYEITSCIAYEMAIRNRELLKLIYLYVISPAEKQKMIIKKLNLDFFFDIKCIQFFLENFDVYYQLMQIHAPELNIEKIMKKKEHNIPTIKISKLHLTEYSSESDKEKSLEDKEVISFQHQVDKTTTPFREYLTYDLSRPTLLSGRSTEVYFEINPKLPENEIIKYIKHVLSKLNKKSEKNSIWVEDEMKIDVSKLLKEKNISIEQKSINKKYKDKRHKLETNQIDKKLLRQLDIPELSMQTRLANQLFIYDYICSKRAEIVKKEDIYNVIKKELDTNLHQIIIKNNKSKLQEQDKINEIKECISYLFTYKTIMKYYNELISYIEGKKYISLID
ncbi:hypothetical protein [Sulfurimonas sp.]